MQTDLLWGEAGGGQEVRGWVCFLLLVGALTSGSSCSIYCSALLRIYSLRCSDAANGSSEYLSGRTHCTICQRLLAPVLQSLSMLTQGLGDAR